MEFSVSPTDDGSPKRQPNDQHNDPDQPPRKLTKHSNNDFSAEVRAKRSQGARTGQACDRCKTRKIKCDARPEGCSPCQMAHILCKTTDRNSNQTYARGYTEKLQSDLRNALEDLDRYKQLCQQLQMNQVASSGSPAANTQILGDYHRSRPSVSQAWDSNVPSLSASASDDAEIDAAHTAPSIGMSAYSPPDSISMLNGTTLSLSGLKIDVAEFEAAGDEALLDATSPETFHEFASNKVAIAAPAFPMQLGDAQFYAGHYFRGLNPYLPFLHKPDFFALLSKVYSKEQKRMTPLTAAEEVMVHMVLSEVKYQHGQRNGVDEYMTQSIVHYKYCLTRMHELLANREIPDIQALLLITFKIRGFPKPGAAWQCCQNVLAMAIEMNLHRSAESLPEEQRRTLSDHDKEMRKRIFWVIYSLSAELSGKLGKPPMIRHRDFDIEFPRPLPDQLPEEMDQAPPAGVRPEIYSCSFRVGVEIMKQMSLKGQMYAELLNIKRGKKVYAAEVIRLESELQKWKDNLPQELRYPATGSAEWQIFAIYNYFFELEFRFLLRHPVLHSRTNPEMFALNAEKSWQVYEEMRKVVQQLLKTKAFDTVWMNVTTLLAAIFTILFLQEKRKHEITADEVTKLKTDMVEWKQILRDVGQLLGIEDKLADSTNAFIDDALGRIEKTQASRGLSDGVAPSYAVSAPGHNSEAALPAHTPTPLNYSRNNSHIGNLKLEAPPLLQLQSSGSSYDSLPTPSPFIPQMPAQSHGFAYNEPHSSHGPPTPQQPYPIQMYGSGYNTMPTQVVAPIVQSPTGLPLAHQPQGSLYDLVQTHPAAASLQTVATPTQENTNSNYSTEFLSWGNKIMQEVAYGQHGQQQGQEYVATTANPSFNNANVDNRTATNQNMTGHQDPAPANNRSGGASLAMPTDLANITNPPGPMEARIHHWPLNVFNLGNHGGGIGGEGKKYG